jgi:hypothetical protein
MTDSQKNLSMYVGMMAGAIVYVLYSVLDYGASLNMYASLRFFGLLYIVIACIFAAHFAPIFQILMKTYEKIRYIKNRPHHERSSSRENSHIVDLMVVLFFMVISLVFGISERMLVSTGIGVILTRIVKTSLVYRSGHACRLYWPISSKVYETSDIMPEAMTRMFWKPVEVYALGMLMFLFVSLIPPLQELIIRFFFYSDAAISSLGI